MITELINSWNILWDAGGLVRLILIVLACLPIIVVASLIYSIPKWEREIEQEETLNEMIKEYRSKKDSKKG